LTKTFSLTVRARSGSGFAMTLERQSHHVGTDAPAPSGWASATRKISLVRHKPARYVTSQAAG